MNESDIQQGSGPGHFGQPSVVLTRFEEQLRVHLPRRPYERIVLRKSVVTEVVNLTVEVRREELHVERIAVDDPDGQVLARGMEVPDLVEGEVLEVIVRAERPIVGVESVPIERVRVIKEISTREETFHANLRVERIDTEGSTVPVTTRSSTEIT